MNMAGRREHNLVQRRTFDRLVDVFEEPLREGVGDRLRTIVAAGLIRPGQAVLDVGTGTGVLLPLIQQYNPGRTLACDLSPRMLERVEQKFPGVELINSDLIDLKLSVAALDAAFLNGMFSNVWDKPAALTKLAELLRPGGHMVVSHPEGREFIQKLRDRVEFRLDLLPGRQEWEDLLAHLPFETVEFRDESKLFLAVARRKGD